MKQLGLILLFCITLFAENIVEYDYELDIYYSNISAYLDLDRDHNITDATNFSETEIYSDLLSKTLSPNIFLVELSLHPMAWGGVWYRKQYPDKYEEANINNFNLVKALTAGWEEPYSVSFFVGRMMIFRNKQSRHIGANRAFIGYLLSLGNKSIKDNFSYHDNWANVEFKLKGTKQLKNRDLDWSFRLGYRHHSNNDFVDTVYIGARRSSLDFNKSIYSLRYNSAFETLLECSTKNMKITKGEFIVEKKFPMGKKVAFGLGVGYLYYGGNRYQNELLDEGIDRHQLILRPNFSW